jgi:hypothetical protein
MEITNESLRLSTLRRQIIKMSLQILYGPFYVATITSMVKVWNFQLVCDKSNVDDTSSSVNRALKWVTAFYNC